MATPTPTLYGIPHGVKALCGRVAALPAWLAGKPLNTWIEIPNTAGAGGASINAYSGLAEKDGMLISAAAGGHNDSYDNRVTSIDCMQDAPGWILRCAPTPFAQVIPDAAYGADGKPTSGHNRCELYWVPAYNRVMRVGARDLYTEISPGSQPTVDGFNLDTNTWDAPGTWPNILGGKPFVIGGAFVDVDGYPGCYSGQLKMSGTTPAWSALSTVIAPGIRAPWATCVARNLVFGLAMGLGWQGESTTYRAIKVQNGVQTAITITRSAALDDFEATAPFEAGMWYDPPNDRFVFSNGSKEWAVIPNNTNTWDMVAVTYASGVRPPPPGVSAGSAIENRFIYSPALKGFFMVPNVASNVYFVRTA